MNLSMIWKYLRLMVAENVLSFPSTMKAAADGIVPDTAALYGMFAFRKNVDDYLSNVLTAIPTSASATVTLTPAQFFSNFIDFTSTNNSGIALTTPSVAQILGALPPTVPQNGFSFFQRVLNDASGQTVTYTAGANVTLSAKTATILTDTARDFLVNINVAAGTVTIVGLGGGMTL
jgi:hypothetical protein